MPPRHAVHQRPWSVHLAIERGERVSRAMKNRWSAGECQLVIAGDVSCCFRKSFTTVISSATRLESASFSNTPSFLKAVPTTAPSATGKLVGLRLSGHSSIDENGHFAGILLHG